MNAGVAGASEHAGLATSRDDVADAGTIERRHVGGRDCRRVEPAQRLGPALAVCEAPGQSRTGAQHFGHRLALAEHLRRQQAGLRIERDRHVLVRAVHERGRRREARASAEQERSDQREVPWENGEEHDSEV